MAYYPVVYPSLARHLIQVSQGNGLGQLLSSFHSSQRRKALKYLTMFSFFFFFFVLFNKLLSKKNVPVTLLFSLFF